MDLKKLAAITAMLLIVASYFFLEPVNMILSKNFNLLNVTRFFAESLYPEAGTVSQTPLVVKDYILIENTLYVFPLDDKVTLPIDVMVVGVDNFSLEVIDSDSRYVISNLKSRSKNLYQYVTSLNEIGTTADFYIVTGDNIDRISERLLIYYEKV